MSAPARRPGLSACIITFNEEDRIRDCIASVDFCDEVLVVDSHSTDCTREVAARCGARVIERDWPGYAAQKAFAVGAARHDWVLCLDADERLDRRLRWEIIRLRDAGFPGHAGWRMRRLSHYLGDWIRHGVWRPDWNLRLFDRRRGRWVGEVLHEKVVVDGSVGRLRGELLHYPYRSLAEHLATMERYTSLMARGLHARGKRAHAARLVLNPTWRFLKSYLFKMGFLDGWRGLVVAYLAAHYVRLKYLKLLALQRAGEEIG